MVLVLVLLLLLLLNTLRERTGDDPLKCLGEGEWAKM